MSEALRVAWTDSANGEVIVWDSADRFVARRLANGTWERATVKVGDTAELDRVNDPAARDALLNAARAALRVYPVLSEQEEDDRDTENQLATMDWVAEELDRRRRGLPPRKLNP